MLLQRFVSCIFFCCLVFQSLNAQNFAKDFSPSRKHKLNENLIKEINTKYDSLVRNTDFPDRKAKKYIKETITESKKRIKTLDSADLLMYTDTITRYLQVITDKIQKSNALIRDKKLTIFTYRTDVPNASNRAAGVIFINLDLITKLHNEAEMAFIISHEISHDVKGHVMASLLKGTELEENEEFRKELKKILKQDYGRLKAVETLFFKYMSKYTEHSRGHELQADSLGLIFYASAGYPSASAIKTIQILDSVDTPVYTNKIDYMKFFNFPSYAFKKSWLVAEEEESIGGNATAFKLPDSLKTHPDCKIRAATLEKMVPNLKFQPANGKKESYEFYRLDAEFEMIEFLQQDYELSTGLYSTLQLLNLYPDNIYLKCSVVNILYELKNSQSEHYFSAVTDFPDKKFCESYNQMLVFLHNTNSDVLKNLAINYFNANLKNASSSPFAGYVAILLKSIDVPQEEKFKLIAEYKSRYSDAYYIKKLERKFTPKKK
jgi:Zn-dependent protease with chaperone function